MTDFYKNKSEQDRKTGEHQPTAPIVPTPAPHPAATITPRPHIQTTRVFLSATPQIVASHSPADVPSIDFGPRINIAGQMYEHVADAADGTWIFAPNK